MALRVPAHARMASRAAVAPPGPRWGLMVGSAMPDARQSSPFTVRVLREGHVVDVEGRRP